MTDGAVWNGMYIRAPNGSTDGPLVENVEITAVVVASQPLKMV